MSYQDLPPKAKRVLEIMMALQELRNRGGESVRSEEFQTLEAELPEANRLMLEEESQGLLIPYLRNLKELPESIVSKSLGQLQQLRIPSRYLGLKKSLVDKIIPEPAEPTSLVARETKQEEFPVSDIVFSKLPITTEELQVITAQVLANLKLVAEKSGENKGGKIA